MVVRRNNFQHPRRQRGAIAVSAAIAMLASLIAIAFSLDLGRNYYAQRDLQRMANLAALDAARIVGGCMGPVENPQSLALTEATASVLRNRGEVAWVAGGDVNVGSMDSSSGVRFFSPDDNPQQRAVQVRLARTAPTPLLPIFTPTGGPATLRAEASAYSSPKATIHVGSGLASVNPPVLNSLLSELLGDPVSLSLATYNALLNTQVSIPGLLEELNVGAPGTDLTQTPVQGQAVLNALLNQVVGDAAAGLTALAATAGAQESVVLGDLLGMQQPVEGATILLADLVMGLARSAAGDTLLDLDILPPLTDLNARIISPGQSASLVPGGTDVDTENFAENAQVVIETSTPLNLNLGIVNLSLQLPMFIQAAQATAVVDAINCARHGVPVSTVDVSARSSAARVGIGHFDNINSPNPQFEPAEVIASASVLGIPIEVGLLVGAFADIPATASAEFPGMEVEDTETLGTPSTGAVAQGLVDSLGNITDLQVTSVRALVDLGPLAAVVNPILNSILGLASGVIAPVLSAALTPVTGALDTLLTPTLEGLGVSLGGADITVIAIEADQPYLFTH